MKACTRIFNSPPILNLGIKPLNSVFDGCEEFLNDEDLYFRCATRIAVVMLNRPTGTARMGSPLDETSVVDPELR